jgi:hypothetical protein
MGVERAGVDVRTFGLPGECPGILLVAKGLGRPRLRAFPYPFFGSNETYQVSLDSFGTRAWLHFPSLSSRSFTGPGPFKSSTWIAKVQMHMLRVHNEGIAECGYEMAKAKTTQVIAFAREHLHSL